jgi:hypothetical protein
MPLSAAERQRRRREKIKLNAQTLEQHKEKKHEYYMKSRKPIASSTDREKRLRIRGWKKAQKDKRARAKLMQRTLREVNTPGSSSSDTDSDDSGDTERTSTTTKSSEGAIRQTYLRKISHLKGSNMNLTSKLRASQAKCRRLQMKATTLTTSRSIQPTTPRSKSDHLMSQSPSKVRKTLVFHHALVQELRGSNSRFTSYRDKQIMSKVLYGKILKKYKLLSVANREFGLRLRPILRNKDGEAMLHYIPRKYGRFRLDNAKSAVEQFFAQDINSHASAGRKETIMRNKEKKQKRYLNDTVKNIHKKFCREMGPISYTAFRKLKPFWIVQSVDRNTCACKKCHNIKLKVYALHRLGELSTQDVAVLLSTIKCSIASQSCMYNECKLCRSKCLAFSEKIANDSETSWFEWVAKTERRTQRQPDGSNKTFIVHVVVKSRISEAVKTLKERLCCELMQYSIHTYNIGHQYKELKNLRDHLKSNECVVLVDFSENYAAKYATEIQAVHFGASRSQVTLHTGVYYTAGLKTSFCTVSEINRHDPSAIWAHLKPILTDIQKKHIGIDTIHFISDSPSTQYRSVKNLFLMKRLIHDKYGFAYATWNFTESSHGKGPADGVGGLVKRTADGLVNLGNDIPDASTYSTH